MSTFNGGSKFRTSGRQTLHLLLEQRKLPGSCRVDCHMFQRLLFQAVHICFIIHVKMILAICLFLLTDIVDTDVEQYM